jgi:hypothetical protein
LARVFRSRAQEHPLRPKGPKDAKTRRDERPIRMNQRERELRNSVNGLLMLGALIRCVQP